MPISPKTICTYPGCNTLVLNGRCSRHPNKPKPRPSSTAQGYDQKWKAKRAEYLRYNRVCEYQVKCDGAPATEVDHIKPLKQGGTHDDSNLAATCKRCHSYKTATADMKRYRGAFDSHA